MNFSHPFGDSRSFGVEPSVETLGYSRLSLSLLIRQISKEVLQVEQGSIYPALYRLEEQGWISSEWGASENNRKAKFYKLTPAGRKQLVEERSNWERLSSVINLILKTT